MPPSKSYCSERPCSIDKPRLVTLYLAGFFAGAMALWAGPSAPPGSPAETGQMLLQSIFGVGGFALLLPSLWAASWRGDRRVRTIVNRWLQFALSMASSYTLAFGALSVFFAAYSRFVNQSLEGYSYGMAVFETLLAVAFSSVPLAYAARKLFRGLASK